MARRSIGYFKESQSAPLPPVVVRGFVTYKNWVKMTGVDVVYSVDLGNPRHNGEASFTLSELVAFRNTLDKAIADADRMIAVDAKEQAKFRLEEEIRTESV